MVKHFLRILIGKEKATTTVYLQVNFLSELLSTFELWALVQTHFECCMPRNVWWNERKQLLRLLVFFCLVKIVLCHIIGERKS